MPGKIRIVLLEVNKSKKVCPKIVLVTNPFPFRNIQFWLLGEEGEIKIPESPFEANEWIKNMVTWRKKWQQLFRESTNLIEWSLPFLQLEAEMLQPYPAPLEILFQPGLEEILKRHVYAGKTQLRRLRELMQIILHGQVPYQILTVILFP